MLYIYIKKKTDCTYRKYNVNISFLALIVLYESHRLTEIFYVIRFCNNKRVFNTYHVYQTHLGIEVGLHPYLTTF